MVTDQKYLVQFTMALLAKTSIGIMAKSNHLSLPRVKLKSLKHDRCHFLTLLSSLHASQVFLATDRCQSTNTKQKNLNQYLFKHTLTLMKKITCSPVGIFGRRVKNSRQARYTGRQTDTHLV